MKNSWNRVEGPAIVLVIRGWSPQITVVTRVMGSWLGSVRAAVLRSSTDGSVQRWWALTAAKNEPVELPWNR